MWKDTYTEKKNRLPSIASTRERTSSKPTFTSRQTFEIQVSNFEVFLPKCKILFLDAAQREDVFNQQEGKKLSERRPTFKRFAEDYTSKKKQSS